MTDECLNYEKVMKYILAGVGITLAAYIFFKYQFKNQSIGSLDSKNSSEILRLEKEIHDLKNQLTLTQEQLENLNIKSYNMPSNNIQSNSRLKDFTSTIKNQLVTKKISNEYETVVRQKLFSML